MSKPAYADEKQEPSNVGVLYSDGASSIDSLTALIAEGERV
jgi:hypothetical protein